MPVIIDSVLRAGEGKTLRKLKRIAEQVNSIEEDFAALSDDPWGSGLADSHETFASRTTIAPVMRECFIAILSF